MIVEIVNTGSELMLGRVLNTHQQWLCRRLADLGILSRPENAPKINDAYAKLKKTQERIAFTLKTGKPLRN